MRETHHKSSEGIKADPALALIPVDSYRIFFNYLAPLDDKSSPLQDKRVCQALNHAVDKKTLIDTIFYGYIPVLYVNQLRRLIARGSSVRRRFTGSADGHAPEQFQAPAPLPTWADLLPPKTGRRQGAIITLGHPNT